MKISHMYVTALLWSSKPLFSRLSTKGHYHAKKTEIHEDTESGGTEMLVATDGQKYGRVETGLLILVPVDA